MSIAESFVGLLDSMNILTVCLWTTGFVIFCVEYFNPMRGVAYALGSLLICAAFVTCMINGTPGEAFVFVLLTALAMFVVHVVSVATQKRDWLRVSRMEKTGERNRKYGRLIGNVGIANTPIDRIGNVTVSGLSLVVYSEKPIAQGERVMIAKVTADRIIVERVN